MRKGKYYEKYKRRERKRRRGGSKKEGRGRKRREGKLEGRRRKRREREGEISLERIIVSSRFHPLVGGTGVSGGFPARMYASHQMGEKRHNTFPLSFWVNTRTPESNPLKYLLLN
jgi:hypothetical protein